METPGGNRKPVSEHISVIEKNARDGLKPLDKLSKVKIRTLVKSVFPIIFPFRHEFPPEFRSVENQSLQVSFPLREKHFSNKTQIELSLFLC